MHSYASKLAKRQSVNEFKSRDEKWLKKEILGAERSSTDIFL